MSVHFFEVYSDIGAGKHGTTQGVAMLSAHCHSTYPTATVSKIEPTSRGVDFAHPHGKYIEHLTPFFEQILLPTLQNGLMACQEEGKFPIVLSGDHSNAMGNVSAFLNHHKNKKVAIVWIDAHADLHSVYTTPSGNLHGMPLGAVLGLDNKDCQINELSDEACAYWQTLKSLSQSKPAPNDVCFLGVRDTESPEEHLIEKYGIFCYSTLEHRRLGFDNVLADLTKQLADYDAIYVSFDIDSLDKALVPATGTPVDNGYTLDEMKAIFDALLTLPNVGLFEITEFNPTLDDDEQKHKTIFEALDYAVGILKSR